MFRGKINHEQPFSDPAASIYGRMGTWEFIAMWTRGRYKLGYSPVILKS